MPKRPTQRTNVFADDANQLLGIISGKRFGFTLLAKFIELQVFVVLTLLGSEDEVHINRQVLNLPDWIADDFTTPTAQAIADDGRSHLSWDREAISQISNGIGDKNDR